MKPTLEEIVAAFRDKQLAEDVVEQRKRQAATVERDARRLKMKLGAEDLQNDFLQIFAAMIRNGDATVGAVVDAALREGAFRFPIKVKRPRRNASTAVEWDRRDGVCWIDSAGDLRYRVSGHWGNQPFVFDSTTNKTELLVQMCAAVGSRMAKITNENIN